MSCGMSKPWETPQAREAPGTKIKSHVNRAYYKKHIHRSLNWIVSDPILVLANLGTYV